MAISEQRELGDEAALEPGTFARVDLTSLRRLSVAAYLVVLAAYCMFVGVPIDRVGMTLWIVAGLSVLCIGRGWRAWRMTLLAWLPFEGVLLAYDYSYGFAGRFNGELDVMGFPMQGATNLLGMPLHTTFPIEADRWLFGGTLPGQWLQEHLRADGPIGWVGVPVTLTYLSHFVVTPMVAVALWIWNRDRFLKWVRAVVSLAVVGLSIYLLFPMAPPWLATQQGLIPGWSIVRANGDGFHFMGLRIAQDVLADGQARSNPVAAMPSLHMAFATLAVLFFWSSVRRSLRPLLLLYPAMMAFTLLYSGEHYAIDEIAGVLAALLVTAFWWWVDRWWQRRRSAGEVPDSQRLLGAPEGTSLVAERGRGEAETIGAEGD
ncbi:phosphatase PAP2 family protein [Branchiibius sp. NY16-3462-2]|uniref:phosphatase PAP2 family protein n=1 Tax=Branchiibius sp. NY16-3462-2 TaxID=1807500 RepID=UPI0025BE7631|nr:phosphatase PAP2 family protein [Branchiibius sp. NY16-3462-2]